MDDEIRYWPYPVLKSEADWDDFDRDFLDFMRVAYADGYRPRHPHSGTGAVEADSPSGRSIFLVYRGRYNGWEPWQLRDGEQGVSLGAAYDLPLGDSACVCIRPPFRAVAHFSLEWLRGRALDSLLSDFIFVGGSPTGIELRPEVASLCVMLDRQT